MEVSHGRYYRTSSSYVGTFGLNGPGKLKIGIKGGYMTKQSESVLKDLQRRYEVGFCQGDEYTVERLVKLANKLRRASETMCNGAGLTRYEEQQICKVLGQEKGWQEISRRNNEAVQKAEVEADRLEDGIAGLVEVLSTRIAFETSRDPRGAVLRIGTPDEIKAGSGLFIA